MKKPLLTGIALLPLIASSGWAQQTPGMLTLTIQDIKDGQPIPPTFAFCAPDGKGQSKDGGNSSPALSWAGAPAQTKSFAVLVVDRDVPASFDLANQPGKTIPASAPRQDFYHWVLTDIPPDVTSLPQGAYSKSMTSIQPENSASRVGISGQNDFARIGKGPGMGYDGPCPPWNDARLHHYHFMVYALDTPTTGLTGTLTGPQVLEAIHEHTLAKGEITGTYTQNPAMQPQ
jgi:Raf kinase inhibitor-like YbhB/YbcL family protein